MSCVVAPAQCLAGLAKLSASVFWIKTNAHIQFHLYLQSWCLSELSRIAETPVLIKRCFEGSKMWYISLSV